MGFVFASVPDELLLIRGAVSEAVEERFRVSGSFLNRGPGTGGEGVIAFVLCAGEGKVEGK